MGTNHNYPAGGIKSVVSFAPLVARWKKTIEDGRDGNRQLYQQFINEISGFPELLGPISGEETVKTHAPLIERFLSTLFPLTLSDERDLYAVLQPFNHRVLLASSAFKKIFVSGHDAVADLPMEVDAETMMRDKICGAYQLILNKLYNVKTAGTISSVHRFVCPETKLDRYMEVCIDTGFVDVVTEGELPQLTLEELDGVDVHHLLHHPTLTNQLPLERFQFHGFAVLRITEVTEREIINKIKNSLLNIHSFGEEDIFSELDYQMQNLAGIHQLHTAIKPFFMVNNHLILSEIMTRNNTAKKYPLTEEQQYRLYQNIVAIFTDSPETIVISDINQATLERYPFLYILYEHNFKSVIVAPLCKENKELLGILIIAHRTERLRYEHLARIRPAIPLFAIALQKKQEHLDHEVDRIIREQFTAVQEAVEWRFTKAALNQLTRKDKSPMHEMEPIVFEQVFPLYGSIDIRNSSIERNNAIQLDLLEQLQLAADIIKKARAETQFPLLEELQYRTEKYIDSVSKILFAEEETTVHDFLSIEMAGLMSHLKPIIPNLEKEITEYLDLINSPVRMLYHHRREYEESITQINTEIAKLIDTEQKNAQSIYPHYFERFVTDGVDYNIYVGQSITPRIPFNEFYLKNLKIWQLTTLVKAAQLARSLEGELRLPLRTTQLILAHSSPISISFKTAERKFDVDGAYNMRYEIIKKRIDKVRIKESNERLTQPGTIAIVYSQTKEANEYLAYIEFLQNKKLLQDKVERFDLEELQGISGLKGLRAMINYNQKEGIDKVRTVTEASDLLLKEYKL